MCIWTANTGNVRKWEVGDFKPLYGDRFPHWATVIEFVRWSGDNAILHIYDIDAADPSERIDKEGMFVSVNVTTDEIGHAARPR